MQLLIKNSVEVRGKEMETVTVITEKRKREEMNHHHGDKLLKR